MLRRTRGLCAAGGDGARGARPARAARRRARARRRLRHRRVTAALAERVPRGHVIAVDGSPAMVEARERLGPGVEVFAADLLELELDEPVDAILSTATFHWIADHDRLFSERLFALRPGGRIVAQCGGGGQRRLRGGGDRRVAEPALAGWPGPWNFQSPDGRRPGSSGRLHRHPHLAAGSPSSPTTSARVPVHGDARSHLERITTPLTYPPKPFVGELVVLRRGDPREWRRVGWRPLGPARSVERPALARAINLRPPGAGLASAAPVHRGPG